jgi:hypothetical protein
MIQIGEQALRAAFSESPPPDPGDSMRGHLGHERQLDHASSGETPTGVLFVSPPPLPFPRVFPGL